jgi:hypothetical protein
MDFVDWCGDNDVPEAEVTSYFFPPDTDAKFRNELKRRAYLRGVCLTGTAVENNFALPRGEKLSEQIAYTKNGSTAPRPWVRRTSACLPGRAPRAASGNFHFQKLHTEKGADRWGSADAYKAPCTNFRMG